jgi:hypothetical protein
MYNIFVAKSEGNRPLGRPRCRWEDNMKMVLREIRFESTDWNHVAHDMEQWQVFEHGNELFGSMKGATFLD